MLERVSIVLVPWEGRSPRDLTRAARMFSFVAGHGPANLDAMALDEQELQLELPLEGEQEHG